MPDQLPDHHGAAAAAAVPSPRADSWTAILLATFGVCALGYAIQISAGRFDPVAVVWMSLAIVAAALAVTAPPIAFLERAGFGAFLGIVAAGLAMSVAQHYVALPGVYLTVSSFADLRHFHMLLGLATVVAASGLAVTPWMPRWRLPLVVALYVLMGVWVIRNVPQPDIDVWFVHQEASRGLMEGKNPHAMRFRDIYGANSPYLPKELSENGWLKMGYPYPPLSLFLAVPGYALLGDHRYSNLLAGAVAAALMATARSSPRATLAAALFLLTPRGLQVIEDSWTEPLVLMLLAATVFAACRRQWWMPVALGLFFAVKQYTPIFLPATLLLLPPGPTRWKGALRMYGIAAATALIFTLPMAMWNVKEFAWSVLQVQSKGPYRPDSLSFFPLFTRTGPVPLWPSLLFLLVAYALILWRAPRTPAGFAASVGVIAVGFFALSKQAFLNYHYFTVGALACAAAVAGVSAATAQATSASSAPPMKCDFPPQPPYKP